jgi:hypothetical protein
MGLVDGHDGQKYCPRIIDPGPEWASHERARVEELHLRVRSLDDPQRFGEALSVSQMMNLR